MTWTEIKEKAAPVDVFWRKKGLTSCTDAHDRDIALALLQSLYLGISELNFYACDMENGRHVRVADVGALLDKYEEDIKNA